MWRAVHCSCGTYARFSPGWDRFDCWRFCVRTTVPDMVISCPGDLVNRQCRAARTQLPDTWIIPYNLAKRIQRSQARGLPRLSSPNLHPKVRWQSGDAADCKSANVGSIPARTSSIVNNLADHRGLLRTLHNILRSALPANSRHHSPARHDPPKYGRDDLRRVGRDHLRLCLHNRTWWHRPQLVEDAVAEVSRETHEAELKTMARVFADVKTTDEIVAMLSEGVR